jgi:hypothetical protein
MTTTQVPEQRSAVRTTLLDLADEIQKLSEIGAELANSKLKQRTIVLLLADMTKLAQRDIKAVLEALPVMRKTFLKS